MDSNRTRELAVDVAMLASVPLVLLVVFAFPRAVRVEYALAYAEPSLVTAYTMHFVHLSVDHLLANLVGYLLIVPLAWLVAARANRHRAFRVAFVTFLVAFPFVLSALNLLLPRARLGYGFSGVLLAFAGFLALVIPAFIASRTGDTPTADSAPALFFVVMGIVAVLTVGHGPLRLLVLLLSGVGLALSLRGVSPIAASPAALQTFLDAEGTEYAAAGLVVLGGVPFVGFPDHLGTGGPLVNNYAHLLGFCLGFIAPYVTLRLVDL